MDLAIRNEISILTAAIIIAIAAVISFSAILEMKDIISKERKDDFSERIRVIIDELNETVSELNDTGLKEFFEEDFKNDVLDILKNRYYVNASEKENSPDNTQTNFSNKLTNFYPQILDKHGNVIMHPELERGSQEFANTDFVKRMFEIKNGSLDYKFNGKKEWMVFQLFEEWNWTIIYSCEDSVKYSEVNSFRVKNLFISIVIGILGISLMYVVVFRQLIPLNRTTQMIKDISDGEGDLTSRLVINSQDEIGEMGGYFNIFIGNLNNMVSRIKSITGRNLIVKKDLGLSTNQVSSSLSNITDNVNDIRKQIKKLNGNILDSSVSVEDISKNLSILNNLIEDQSTMVQQSTASVTEMIASVSSVAAIIDRKKVSTEKLVTTAKSGGDKLGAFIRVVKEITQTIETILNMSATISSIASQSNLLSMNAAIEAAHAGDAGKGFAVVAEEIRKLAETSSSNSKDISKALKTIVEKMKTASSSSEITRAAFEEIDGEINDVTRAFLEISSNTFELQSGGNQILKAMTELQTVTEKVKTGSGNISRSSRDTDSAMMIAKGISGDVRNAIEEISNRAGEINTEMEHVSSAVNSLDNATNELEMEINKFKTKE